MLLECPARGDRTGPVSTAFGSQELLVTLARNFQRGGDRSQTEEGLGVNRR